MLFINNKYTKWYFEIISKAQKTNTDMDGCDIHHIVPRSLGGTDCPDNLVKLSVREHLIVHHLLTKMVSGNQKIKMVYAYNMMSNFKKYNSRTSERMKIEVRKIISDRMSGTKHPLYGKKRSIETIERRLANTDRNKLRAWLGKTGKEHPSFGKKLSDDHKNKISKSSKGHRKPEGCQVGNKNNNFGKKHPGLNTGVANPMYGLTGENNPNFGSNRTEEQKYNIKIGKIKKKIPSYLEALNMIKNDIDLPTISEKLNISMFSLRQIKNGNHVICQYYRENYDS